MHPSLARYKFRHGSFNALCPDRATIVVKLDTNKNIGFSVSVEPTSFYNVEYPSILCKFTPERQEHKRTGTTFDVLALGKMREEQYVRDSRSLLSRSLSRRNDK